MKKTILIINAHQKYEGISEGKLNKIFVDTAATYLKNNNFNIIHTHTEQPYIIEEELQKLVQADFIIFQSPIYWFGMPWITKKYFDEVWSAGYTTVTCSGDGRTREDPSRRYGTGGLMNDKSYMLSLTYASPKMEFDDLEGFYNGKSMDDANVGTHKIFQFCGLKMLKSYAIFNVHKEENINIEEELSQFKQILTSNFINN